MQNFKQFYTKSKYVYSDEELYDQVISKFKGKGYYIRITGNLRWLANVRNNSYAYYALKIDMDEDRFMEMLATIQEQPEQTNRYLNILKLSNKHTHINVDTLTEEQYVKYVTELNQKMGVPLLDFNKPRNIEKIINMQRWHFDLDEIQLPFKPGFKLAFNIDYFDKLQNDRWLKPKCYRMLNIGSVDFSYDTYKGDGMMGDQTYAFFPDTFNLVETIPYAVNWGLR
jgi:hypothetical protein